MCWKIPQKKNGKKQMLLIIPKKRLPGKWLNGLELSATSPVAAVLSTSNVPLLPLRVTTAICRLPSSTRRCGFWMDVSSSCKRNANSKYPSTMANATKSLPLYGSDLFWPYQTSKPFGSCVENMMAMRISTSVSLWTMAERFSSTNPLPLYWLENLTGVGNWHWSPL